MWWIVRKAKELWSWLGFVWGILGFLGVTAVITGLATSIGGAAWAIMTGISLPIAIMAGYCTLVGAVYLVMAPMAFRILLRSQDAKASIVHDEKPNYEAVRHIDRFTLADAAKLWCDRDPNSTSTYDTSAWVDAFQSAIRSGELKFDPRSKERDYQIRERDNPASDTFVTKDALKVFAHKHGYDRRFLRDNP